MSKTLIVILLSCFGLSVNAQSIGESWEVDLRSQFGIVKNNARFDNVNGEEVLYFAERGEKKYLFTNRGLIVRQPEESSPQEKYERHERAEKGLPVSLPHFSTFTIAWAGISSAVELTLDEPYQFSYNYQDIHNSSKTIKETPHASLVYQNIYEHIDLRFTLPEEGGLKYEYIVRPGGDPSDISMFFEDADIELNDRGEVEIASWPHEYIDKAPVCWYQDKSSDIPVKFEQDGQNVSFLLGEYDSLKTIVIDPWLVTGLPFTDVQQAYDVGIDREGNVAILGEHGNEVALYDNTGTLMWVWLSPGDLNEFYGGMDMNPYNGEIYYMFMALFLGIEDVWCLNLDGDVVANKAFISGYDPGELWRIHYNRITDEVIVGAGGLPRESHLCVLDGDLLINLTYAPLPPVPPNLTDATFLESDPCGDAIYLLCSGDGVPLYDNVLYKLDQADPATVIWEVGGSHAFEEISCIGYMGYEVMTGEGPDWYSANGHNGIAASYDLYTYDGDWLYKWDKATGARIDSVEVTGPDLGPWGDLAYCGGIDTDVYGNVYVGTETSLIKYTRDLEFVESIALPDTCYDLRIERNRMTASGKDFVQAWDIEFPEVDFEMSSTPQPCGACEGTATVSDFSATSDDFSYAGVVWSPSGQTTITATDLCVGWHTATVYWTNAICDSIAKTDSVEVIIGAPGTFNVDVDHESCGASCDGAVTVTVEDGFPPFTFDLEGDVNETGVFEDLCPGEYNLIVTDSDSCTYEDLIIIEAGDSIDVDMIVLDEACPGACNGSIELVPTTGDAPFYYEFDGVADDDGILEDLCVGIHTIFVSDSGGCAFVGVAEIETGENMGLDTVLANSPTCYGFNDGSATVETLLGEDPVDYTWIPENPFEGPTYNNMKAGIYTVYAEDANGCRDTLVFEMTQPDSLYATITTTDPLCYGDSTGFAVIDSVYNAQGDLSNISFFWMPNTFGDEGIGVDSAYMLYAGDYTATINDDFGCSTVLDFTIAQPPAMYFTEFGYDPAFCRLFGYQNGNGVVYAGAAGGVPDYNYEWMNMETLETEDNTTWGGLNPGLYRMRVTDENGCVMFDYVELDSVNPEAAFTVSSEQLNEDLIGTEIVFATFTNQSEYFANPNDPDADTTFFWNLNHPMDDWFVSHDYFEQPDTNYAGEAVYEVCLVAINKNGCTDTTCKLITVHVQPELVAPNIFTPGSGANNEFTFEYRAEGIIEFNCTIVNRWGVKVAELMHINDAWDGADMSGSNCNNGVYFYTYSAKSTNGTVITGQGHVQLVRD